MYLAHYNFIILGGDECSV